MYGVLLGGLGTLGFFSETPKALLEHGRSTSKSIGTFLGGRTLC